MGNDVGKRIAMLRKQNGWSQLELAEKLNISDKAVSKWENGGMPSVDLFPKLAQLFNVTIDYLMLGDREEELSAEDEDTEDAPAEEEEVLVEGLDDLGLEELQLILSDQRDLYTEAELKCLQARYHQLRFEMYGEDNSETILESRPCPKCDGINETPGQFCEYCGWDLIHNCDGPKKEEVDLSEKSGVGCLAYLVAYLIPIAGLIWGIVKGEKALIIFSVLMMIINFIVGFFFGQTFLMLL